MKRFSQRSGMSLSGHMLYQSAAFNLPSQCQAHSEERLGSAADGNMKKEISSQGEDLEEPCQDDQNQHFPLGIEDDCLADPALQLSAKDDVGSIPCSIHGRLQGA